MNPTVEKDVFFRAGCGIIGAMKRDLFCMFLAIAAGIWLWQGPFLSQWAALLAWAAAAGTGMKIFRTASENVRRLLPEIFAPAALMAVTAAVYHPFAMGRMPWMADHMVHQMRARLFFEHFLMQGRLSGWTHMQEAGVPFETLYPPGADITLSAVHLLGLGQLSWETTYALTFFAFLMLYVGTFYFLGRRFGSPLAGFLAGFFALTDAGAFRQGGFSFMVQWGVWPLSFSLILSLWSLFMADRWHETGRGFVRSAVLGAMALCVHPFSLFIVFPLHFLLALCRHREAGGWQMLARPLFLLLFSFLLSAWWLVPFLAYGPSFSAPVPALAGSLHQTAAGFVDAAPWGGADAWTAILGIAGAIWILAARRPAFLLALTYYALFALVLGSTSVLAGLDLFSRVPALGHVQFPRFLLVVKAAAFLGGALFAASLRLPEVRPADAPSARLHRFLWIPAALLLVFPVGQKMIENYILPLTDYTTNPPWKQDVLDAARHLSQIASSRPGFFRVALDGPFNDHRLVPIVAHSGLPFVKLSYMPAETFIHAAHENPSDVPRSRDELIRLNVAYVASAGPSSLPDLKLLARFGDIHLYEFIPASSVRYEIDSPGRVFVERFDDERMEFRVSDLPPEGGVLRLYVAPFARWKAAAGGREVPIGEYRPTPRQTFMQIPVRNGRVQFTYERRAPDVAGFWLTACGLALLVLLRMPAAWRETLSSNPVIQIIKLKTMFLLLKIKYSIFSIESRIFFKKSKFEQENINKIKEECNLISQGKNLPFRPFVWLRLRIEWLLMGAAILLAAAAAVWWVRISPDGAFSLHRARVRVEEGLSTRKCPYVFPERFMCGRAHRYVGVEMREVGKKVRRGIWAHPLENARLQIEFPSVWMAGPLKLEGGIADSGSMNSAPVVLRTYFDDRLVDTWSVTAPGVWEHRVIPIAEYVGRKVAVRFEVAASSVGGRHFLFHPGF